MTASNPTQIRALQVHRYGEPPTAAAVAVAFPVCGPHDVVMAPRAAALHVADLLMIKGEYQVRPDLPFVPGMEAAGRVLEVGAGSPMSRVATGFSR